MPWKIRRFWHNSFDDILDNDDLQVAGSGSAISPASLGDFLAPEGSASWPASSQGASSPSCSTRSTLGGNPPFKGLVLAGGTRRRSRSGDLKLTVVAPRKAELAELQKKWNKEIKPLLKKEQPGAAAEVAAYVDKSVLQPVQHRRPRRIARASASS